VAFKANDQAYSLRDCMTDDAGDISHVLMFYINGIELVGTIDSTVDLENEFDELQRH